MDAWFKALLLSEQNLALVLGDGREDLSDENVRIAHEARFHYGASTAQEDLARIFLNVQEASEERGQLV